MSISRETIQTPVGLLSLTEDNGTITECRFTRSEIRAGSLSPLLRHMISQLHEYFSGQRMHFSLPLRAKGTAFQNKVWSALQSIPYGETCSYLQLAKLVGNPKASRAVGTANAKNPICIIIPCHRVILASGNTGSYAGGDDVKVRLLELEKGISESTD